MTTLPLATVRANLSQLVDDAASTHERVEITRNGVRAAVLLGADDFDALQESIAVLSDPELLRAHQDGVAALDAGDSVDQSELSTMMDAGRGERRR